VNRWRSGFTLTEKPLVRKTETPMDLPISPHLDINRQIRTLARS
jgi:hypothetical protein